METARNVICSKGSDILTNLISIQENLIKETMEDIKYLNEIIPNFAFSEIIKKNFLNSENNLNNEEFKNKSNTTKSIKLN